MIDTIKIYTKISKNIYDIIKSKSIVKTSYNSYTGEIYYNIINDSLEGSFDSSLSVRVVQAMFKFDFCLIIEGSFHKIAQGQNSYNGYYNLITITKELIKFVENSYNIKLPNYKHWFVNRIDIAICFDLKENKNVSKYINNLCMCNYPRRNIKYYKDESIYLSGQTTTLKIYNKYIEFIKHDFKKLNKTQFNIVNYMEKIKGYIRFEIEIKSKKLQNIYKKDRYIRVKEIDYKFLKEVWKCEFMKLFKFFENDLTKVYEKEKVEERLLFVYGSRRGMRLYNFYTSILVDGLDLLKEKFSKSTYYDNLKLLKNAGIDFSQTYKLDFDKEIIKFNPFEAEEVL